MLLKNIEGDMQGGVRFKWNLYITTFKDSYFPVIFSVSIPLLCILHANFLLQRHTGIDITAFLTI